MKMKKRCLLLLLVLTLLFSLISCGSASSDGGAYAPGGNGSGAYGDSDSSTSADKVIDTNRKIIKTVYETVETENYDSAIESLKSTVDALGGYFASSRYTGAGAETTRTRTASFEIRIPAERLSEFTGAVGNLATVLTYNETANDVTLAYVDIESRITVLEAEETALLAMLGKATTTTDMLAISKSLSDTQSSLASLRAQKQSYDTLIDYSTVHLDVREVVQERATDGSFFSEVGNDFVESLRGIGYFFRGFAVFLLGSSPVLLLVGAVVVGIIFLVRHLMRREKKTPADPTDEKK